MPHAISPTRLRQTRVLRAFSFLVCVLTIGTLPTGGDGWAGEPPSFQVHSPGLEWRSLAERSGRAPGETLFETLSSNASGVSDEVWMPDVSRYFRELTALGGYFGICTGDIDNDGLPDFFVSNPTGENRLYRNVGNFKFEDITEQAGLGRKLPWSSGASFADVNNDGRLDLFVCAFRRPNRLFINEGNGDDGIPRFVDRAAEFGLNQTRASMNMAFADFDNDGDLDGYLATTYTPPPRGTQLSVRYEGNKPVIVDELSEYWEMIYDPGDRAHLSHSGQVDHLFRNDGGRFTDVTERAGIEGTGSTLGVVWWDFNGDGLADIYAANDFYAADKMYLNQGDGTFVDVAAETVPHTPWSSMGCDFGDLNNDGLLDFIATDMLGSTHYRRNVMLGEITQREWFLDQGRPRQYARNAVFLNTGTSRMMEVAHLTGMAATDWTWGPRIEDFDNDGRQDVLFTNGMIRDVQHADLVNYADKTLGKESPAWRKFWNEQPIRAEANVAFRNLGDLKFENVGAAWGFDQVGVSYGAATADFDNDGDLDLVINNAGAPVSVLRNRSESGTAVRVELRGEKSNRFGIGATLRLRANGVEQIRYVAIAHGWQSGNEMATHFGLGEAEKIESLSISWPGGQRQEFANLPVDRYYRITEPSVVSLVSNELPVMHPMFSKSDHLDGVEVRPHAADELLSQPLLPKRLSRNSYAMAWGDIDLDGDDDLFLGGGIDEAGRIFNRQSDGTFSELSIAALDRGRVSPDVDALFFDSDADGDLDLLVVNGATPDSIVETGLLELYLNNGHGEFAVAPDQLPQMVGSGACVAAADYDGDGDVDLFVGGGTTTGTYPLTTGSHLLINSEGSFKIATPESFADIGLTTDAVWADATGNGQLDLIVTTQWGPVRLFVNKSGTLVQSESWGMEGRSGWWNAIAAGDLDGDSDVDFVVGNTGLNTFYTATTERPVTLYRGDFAGSGQPVLIESYFENGDEYPVRGFDHLFRVVPDLLDRLLNFHEFSGATLPQIFGAKMIADAQRFEVNTLESGVLRNDGAGNFTFEPLPRIAQSAPINDLVLFDVDGDSILDVIAAQNDFSVVPVVGRFDGGLGLLLLGDGTGAFKPSMPNQSGIVVPEAVRRLALTDLNGDGRPDLVLGIPGGKLQTFVGHE